MVKAAVIAAIALMIHLLTAADSAAKLRDLLPGLYGGDGIILADPPEGSPFPSHAPHFTLESANALNQLNNQIAAEIALFPFSSSVSGFTFAFDPTLGTFISTTETLGPLFAERGSTLGRGKFNLSLAYTFFQYDSFEGDDLSDLTVIARHQPDVIPPDDERTSFELDTIAMYLDLDIRVQILSLAATYGLTDRLEIGMLMPFVHVDMEVKARAEVIASPENPRPNIHRFDEFGESPFDEASDDAFGLGDIVLRAKYQLIKSDYIDVAGAMLVKLATGDEDNFLGTGDTTLRPFVAASHTFTDFILPQVNFTPHVNLGYEINVDDSGRHALEYVVGFDVGSRRWSVAAELIGSHESDGDGVGDDILAFAIGAKWNVYKRLLLLANVQLPLNDEGLRSNVIPTLGLEYSF